MEENAKRLALSKRPQLALFFRPVSRLAKMQIPVLMIMIAFNAEAQQVKKVPVGRQSPFEHQEPKNSEKVKGPTYYVEIDTETTRGRAVHASRGSRNATSGEMHPVSGNTTQFRSEEDGDVEESFAEEFGIQETEPGILRLFAAIRLCREETKDGIVTRQEIGEQAVVAEPK